MPSRRLVSPILCLVLLPAGCCLSPAFLVKGPALARCLPEGVHLSDFAERGPLDIKVTIGMKLARLGAYAGTDGHLYDSSGRRIEIYYHLANRGVQLPYEALEDEDRRLRELKKTCTVIEIRREYPLLPLAE